MDKDLSYKRGEIQEIRDKLTPKNKEELDKFSIQILKTNKQDKVNKVFRLLIVFHDIIDKDFYVKPTKEDIDKFFAKLKNSDYTNTYKRDFQIWIKKWLIYRWKDLELIDDIPKLYPNQSDRVQEKDLLDEKEIKKLIEVERDVMWRTLISILYETGCRPEELLNLKWGDIKFTEV